MASDRHRGGASTRVPLPVPRHERLIDQRREFPRDVGQGGHSGHRHHGGGAFPITTSRSWGARLRHSFLRSSVSAARKFPRKQSTVISNAGSSFFAEVLEY